MNGYGRSLFNQRECVVALVALLNSLSQSQCGLNFVCIIEESIFTINFWP